MQGYPFCQLMRNSVWYYFKHHIHSTAMAKSKFEYVRNFEEENLCLPNCYIVIRIDGKNFHRFSDEHAFQKPNDERALMLMNSAACTVIKDFKPEIIMGYGQSDEYSFVFKKSTTIYKRRKFKLLTNVLSLFSSAYVFHWKAHFPCTEMKYPPSFDGRVVLYPSLENLRDYMSWRQADCHINNLYNTVFWALILKGGLAPREAQERLRGTLSSDKNEILFSEFAVNYNNEPELFRKGSVVYPQCSGGESWNLNVVHRDIIGNAFWTENSSLLEK